MQVTAVKILALLVLPAPAWGADPVKAEFPAAKKVQANSESQLVKNLKAGKPQTVVTYGTSLTAGGAWVRQLDAALKARWPGQATVVNSGAGGMWSTWGVENLES